MSVHCNELLSLLIPRNCLQGMLGFFSLGLYANSVLLSAICKKACYVHGKPKIHVYHAHLPSNRAVTMHVCSCSKMLSKSSACTPGLHFMARVTANIGGSQVLAPAPFLVQPHQDLSGTQPSGPMPPGLEPPGWSRPYSPRPPVSARSAFEGLSPSARFHTAPDQVPHSYPVLLPASLNVSIFRSLV